MKKKSIATKQMFAILAHALFYTDMSYNTSQDVQVGGNNNGGGCANGCNTPAGNTATQALIGFVQGPPMIPVPDFRPECISPLTFSVTLPAGVNTAFIADSEGINAALGQYPGASTIAFEGPGSLSPAIFALWRQTRALFVGGFNLQSTTAADVQKNVRLAYTNIDGTSRPMTISNSMYNNAINPNQNLINNPNGFILSDNCNVLVTGTPGATLVLTLNILGSAGYVSKPWSRYAIPAGSSICN